MTTSVSEKFSKKLGRPRVIPADHERVIDFVLSHKSNPSARTRTNAWYRQRAISIIHNAANPERFAWVLPPSEALRDGHAKIKHNTLLYELGRIDDHQELLEAAEFLCQRRPPTKEGLAIIRRWRLNGRTKPASVFDLSQSLCRAFNDYRSAHPDLTRECAGSARTGERTLRVSVDAALRAGIFKASGSFDPMGWSVGARRSFPRP